MDIATLVTTIENVGFPIVMTFALLYFNKKIIGDLSETIKSNTIMLEKIMVMVENVNEGR